MNKKVLLFVVAAIVAVGAFFYFTTPAPEETADPSNHVFSEGNSGVTLIEYGDFQCPACASYFPIISQVKEKYEGIVSFQFRHFPLESLHKNARAGSRAAEAASLQGKFWEMHDYLYTNQSAWQDSNDPLSIFEGYAQAIGIPDLEKFKTDMRSSAVNAVITADLNEGRKLNVTSTPSFVLNGKLLEENPSPTLEAFSALLDKAITDKGGTPPASDTTVPAEDETVPAEDTGTTE